MALLPLKIPPGIVRNGTEYSSKGRFYDAYLTRWTDDGSLKPTGGWRLRSESPSDVVSGAPRAVIAWKDNSSGTWLAIGTHSGLYVQDRGGAVYDITPVGFTVGLPDAIAAGGFGDGDFGDGDYGVPRPDNTLVQPATQLTLDTFGENLNAVSPEDGKIYEWLLNTSNPATQVANSPTCRAIVVTPEGFLFALGTTDPRTISWCDQRNNTLWAPDATNQAGDFPLQTAGALMCGKAIKGGTILLTDIDAHMAQYTGGVSVYSFDRVGSACGAISRQCIAAIDAQAVWMGNASFWIFDGYVRPLDCDVADYVFSDFNTLQASKTYAVRDSANSEVLFYYCSSSSNEIDRCVIWNYKRNHWNIGRVARTCGTDRGVFTYPIFVGIDGKIWEHEVGLFYDGAMPWARGGPVEIGNGDFNMRCTSLIPDEKISGDVSVTIYGQAYPNGAKRTFGPYSVSAKTDVRFEARQIEVLYTGARLDDWRVGDFRLEAKQGSKR